MSAATKSKDASKKKKREKRPLVDLTYVTCASLAVDLRRLIKKHTILEAEDVEEIPRKDIDAFLLKHIKAVGWADQFEMENKHA